MLALLFSLAAHLVTVRHEDINLEIRVLRRWFEPSTQILDPKTEKQGEFQRQPLDAIEKSWKYVDENSRISNIPSIFRWLNTAP